MTRPQLVYVMDTKQHSDCAFCGREYHLSNWYSLTSFYFSRSISSVLLMIPLALGAKAYLIYFLFCRELVVFVWIGWKNQSFSSRFLEFWNCDLRTDLFNGFLQASSPFVKEDMCQIAKENLLCLNNASETYIFISWRHRKLLLVNCKVVLFFIWD